MADVSITCRCGHRGEFDVCPNCGATRTELVEEGRRAGVHAAAGRADPARTFAERRRHIERLVDAAEGLERAVSDVNAGVEGSTWGLVQANNLRLKAICEHLGLKGPPSEEVPVEDTTVPTTWVTGDE